MSHWVLVGVITALFAAASWVATLRWRRTQTTFAFGFNVIAPVVLVHVLWGGAPSWRGYVVLLLYAVYLVNMNVVLLGWTRHTAMAKLDDSLTAAQRQLLPFVMTNAAGWLYCLPAYFAARRVGPLSWVDVLGVATYLVGLVVHFVADLRKKRFKERAENTGRILDTGLWAWSRHPNYFGDVVIYVGWAVFAANPWAWLSPATNMLQYAFDAIPKSEAWAQRRYGDAWTVYCKRTSIFLPLPPRG